MLALETPLTGLPSALPAHLAAELAELLADAERYAAAAQTVNTTRAYASHWNQFQAGAIVTSSSRCRRRPRSSAST